jgi:hypothetical protein
VFFVRTQWELDGDYTLKPVGISWNIFGIIMGINNKNTRIPLDFMGIINKTVTH